MHAHAGPPQPEHPAAAGHTDHYRPELHYTPRRNWMNDPNGLVWYEGEYHLFYQHNPEGEEWGNMSWGHAVSRDLVHWTELDVAIRATEQEHIFSGCAVVDTHNTAGFGAGALVAVYTSWYPDTSIQAQSLAYSTDRGRTWTKYAGNPVLDIGSREFRDPKVFWYEPGGYWVMAVVLALEWQTAFYRSPDLIHWTKLSDFGPAGATDGIWEVPDLIELPVDGNPQDTRWVLAVSLNPGGPAGGSGAQYFIGHFDGTAFTAESGPHWADHGRDFYAAVSWNNTPDGERVWIGWMSNWADAGDHPTRPWCGAQSLPRTLALTTIDGRIHLTQHAVPALDHRFAAPTTHLNVPVPAGSTLFPSPGDVLKLTAEFAPGTARRFGLTLRGTRLGYDTESGTLFVTRATAPTPGHHTAPLPLRDGRVRFTAYLDRSSLEVFADQGQTVITDALFPDPADDTLALFAEDGTAELCSLHIHPLAPPPRAPRP